MTAARARARGDRRPPAGPRQHDRHGGQGRDDLPLDERQPLVAGRVRRPLHQDGVGAAARHERPGQLRALGAVAHERLEPVRPEGRQGVVGARGLVEQHEGLRREVRQGHRRSPGQRVPGGEEGVPARLEEDDGVELVEVAHVVEDRRVDPAVEQRLPEHVLRTLQEVQRDPGVGRLHLVEQPGQHGRRESDEAADADRPGQLGAAPGGVGQLRGVAEQPAGLGQHLPAQRGQGHPLGAAPDAELGTEQPLQLRDRAGDGGGRHEEPVGGRADRAELRDRDEVGELAEGELARCTALGPAHGHPSRIPGRAAFPPRTGPVDRPDRRC